VQEKLRTYNESMKKARGEIFAEQEIRAAARFGRAPGHDQRARDRAQSACRKRKSHRRGSARPLELEQSSDNLANDIAEAILAGALPGREIPRAGRRDEILSPLFWYSLGALRLIFFLMALPVLAAEGAKPDPAESPTG
jgi:hypothetical protein